MARPNFEALDRTGLPLIREAKTIGELPPPNAPQALQEATETIATRLGVPSHHPIALGTPVHLAFKMTRAQSKNHPQAKLLLLSGSEVSLDLCPSYPAAPRAKPDQVAP